MKKSIVLKVMVSALATPMLLGGMSYAQNLPKPPEDSPERKALNRLLEQASPELQKNLDDMMQKMSEKDFLKNVHDNADKLQAKFPSGGFKQTPDMNVDSLGKDGEPPKFEDPRIKMFTVAQWNTIRKAPNAESRKTHIMEMQKKLGIKNPSISAAELLGAFLNEEKRFTVLLEKQAEEKAAEKAKQESEKLAKNKDRPDTKGGKESNSQDKELDKEAEKKALQNGWKKS